MLEKIDNILNRHVKKHGLYNTAKASRICFLAKEVAEDKFEPISFRGGALTISVKNSSEAQEIQMQSASVIKKINQKVGEEVVRRIIFRVRD